MKLLIFMGKMLLSVVLPFVFFAITATLITGIIAFLGFIMGHNTFINCFHGIMDTGITLLLSVIFTVLFVIIYFNNEL
ncbi:hypothetical protein EB001_05375 [bacterium]|nr:hypothetical protein [bacterium]